MARVAGELEPTERSGKVDIPRQGEDLKAAAEHFGMKQRLQGAGASLVSNDLWARGNDSRKKMMLVGEAHQTQSIFLGNLSDVRPVDVRGNVRLGNLFERRIERSMFCANLEDFSEFASSESVIDRQNDSKLQTIRDFRDPIKLGLICSLFIRRIDKNKPISVKANKFVAQINRHRVEQLVGKMDTYKRFEIVERRAPLDPIAKFL